MKRLNKNMHGDDPAFHRLPADPELAAQYLLLYELSLPFGSDLNNRINVAKSATRMTVVVRRLSSQQQHELDARAQAWLRVHAPGLTTDASGISIVFAHFAQQNVESMLRGTITAMGLISFILIWVFKSVRLGLVSLVPNFIPSAMSFRSVGLSGRPRGSCLFGGHRYGLRYHRRRHDSFSDQISEIPPRRPFGARGRALRLFEPWVKRCGPRPRSCRWDSWYSPHRDSNSVGRSAFCSRSRSSSRSSLISCFFPLC